MARYNLIRKMDISDGPGIRVSIFMQGCAFHCKNCFNKETWDFKLGHEFTDETINKVLDLCDNEVVKGLSILGGEPMAPTNIEGTAKLAKAFKEKYPDKEYKKLIGIEFLDENTLFSEYSFINNNSIYIFNPSKLDNNEFEYKKVYDIDKNIKTKVSEGIYKGIKILYRNKVYDFSLNEGNV